MFIFLEITISFYCFRKVKENIASYLCHILLPFLKPQTVSEMVILCDFTGSTFSVPSLTKRWIV